MHIIDDMLLWFDYVCSGSWLCFNN